jgi:hypothetical protein
MLELPTVQAPKLVWLTPTDLRDPKVKAFANPSEGSRLLWRFRTLLGKAPNFSLRNGSH